MPPMHSHAPEPEPGEGPDSRCAGCPGCDRAFDPEAPKAPEPEPSRMRTVVAPIGLFIFPVATAIAGAVLGSSTILGELPGGLLGLAAGMAASALTARALGPG